jgi:hypothetical protein
MSDDTPTQRFPEPGDDTPTQRFDAALTGGEPGAATAGTPVATAEDEELADEKKKSRGLLIGLIALGGALLIAIIVLLVVLLTSGADGTPSADPTPTTSRTPSATPSVTPTTIDTPTPSATPAPTPTETQAPPPPPPPPPPADPIVSYTASTKDANCASPDDSVPITFNWNTTGQSVTFGTNTEIAEDGTYQSGLPPVGGITINYQCANPSYIYSIAVYHDGNVIDRASITVKAD